MGAVLNTRDDPTDPAAIRARSAQKPGATPERGMHTTGRSRPPILKRLFFR